MSNENLMLIIEEIIKNNDKKKLGQFFIKDMKPELNEELIKKLIINKNTNLLEFTFNNYFFNDSILKLLLNYKNKIKLTNNELQNIINKITINKDLYPLASENEKSEIIKILFMNDISKYDIMIDRIYYYEILKHASKLNNIKFVKNILNYTSYNFHSFDSDYCIKESNDDIIKLFINSSFEKINFSDKNKDYENNIELNFILNKLIINSGKLNIIKYFFKKITSEFKFNINLNSRFSENVLITALYHEKYEIFEFLLNNGGDPNIEYNGSSLLSIAIDNNQSENFVKLLLKYKIDINKKDINEQYPLMKAISLNKLNIVKLLINYSKVNNINMDILDIRGNPPIILAYKSKNDNILWFLLNNQYNGIDINKKDLNGNTLLYYALIDNKDNFLKYLINKGANFDLRNNKGNSLIFYILLYGKKDIFEYLINNEANISYNYSNSNDTILSLIMDYGEKYLKIVLNNRNKIPLDSCDEYGNTPLLKAIKKSFSNETIIDLIKKGSNVNKINNEGDSPLACAIRNGNLTIAKYLINVGSKIHTHKNNCYDVKICIYDFQDKYTNYNMEDYKFLKNFIY